MAYKAKYDYLNNEEELEKEIEEHKKMGGIFEEKKIEQPQIILNFKRAENELKHTIYLLTQQYLNGSHAISNKVKINLLC